MPNTAVPAKYRGTIEYDQVKAELIRAARCRGLLTYEDVGPFLGIFTVGAHLGNAAGQVLGEISEDEHRAGRPMLSAIVVSATNHKPGPGFADLAAKLGLLAPGQDWEPFWRQQCEALYKLWAPKRNR